MKGTTASLANGRCGTKLLVDVVPDTADKRKKNKKTSNVLFKLFC